MDRSELLFSAMKQLKGAESSLGVSQIDDSAVDVAGAREAVQGALQAVEALAGVGECYDGHPPASTFFVILDGKVYLRCAHDPYHEHLISG